jgi:hypothetical protein
MIRDMVATVVLTRAANSVCVSPASAR